MKVLSRWQLTFDPDGESPKVLIAFGDLLDDELDWDLSRSIEVVPLAAAAAPFIRPAGNNAYALDFTVYKTSDTDEAARKAVMDVLRTTDDLGKKPLRLEIATESGPVTSYYNQFANAAIRQLKAKRDLDSSRPRHGRRYSIIATKLTKTTV